MRALPAGVVEREPLASHTSLKVGGAADYFAAPSTVVELGAILEWAVAEDIPVRVIGGGSNLLVADAGVDGLVIKMASARADVEDRDGEPVLVADAGVTFANIARKVAKQGYGGLEWATNVPGTVGGAAVNNAGAFGGDTASALIALTLLDASGSARHLAAADLGYAYRTSVLKRREVGLVVVTQVELRLTRSAPEAAQALITTFQQQRTASQPRRLSAGSVFANPPGTYSGRLIEEAGLKGTRIGHAEISPQHANFIVNLGGATAADVYALMRVAQQTVFERTGTWLRPEIELFGRWTEHERETLRQE